MSLALQKKRDMYSSSQNLTSQSFLQLASQLQSAAGLTPSVPHQKFFQQRNNNSREGSLSKDKSVLSSQNFKNMSNMNYNLKKQKSFEITPSSARHDSLSKGRINRQNSNIISGEHTYHLSDIVQSQRSVRNHALTEPDQCEEKFTYDVAHLNQQIIPNQQKSPKYIQNFHKSTSIPLNQIKVLTPNLNKQNSIKGTNSHSNLQKKGQSAVLGSSKENKCVIIPSNTSELNVSKKNKKELIIENNQNMKTENVPQKQVIFDENNNCYDERHNFNQQIVRYTEELAKQQNDYQQLYSIYIQEKNQREELEQTISQLYNEISRYRAETEATIYDVYEIALLSRGFEEQQQQNHQEKTCQLMSKLHPLVLELGIAGALAQFGEELKNDLEAQLKQQYFSEEHLNKQGSLVESKQSQEISCQYSQDGSGSPSASHRSSSQFSKADRQIIPQNDKITFNFLKDVQHSLVNYTQNHLPTIQDQNNIHDCLIQKLQEPSIFTEHSELHLTDQVNNNPSKSWNIQLKQQNLVLPKQMHEVLSKTCVSELISPSAAFSQSTNLSQERNQALKLLKQPQYNQTSQDNQENEKIQQNQQEYVGEDAHRLNNLNGICKEDSNQTKINLAIQQDNVEGQEVNETTIGVDGSALMNEKIGYSNLLLKQQTQSFEKDYLALKRENNNVNTATQDQEIYYMELSSYFSSEKSNTSQNHQCQQDQEERLNHQNMSSRSLIQTKHLNQNSIHYQEKNIINLRNVSAEETTLEESREGVSSCRRKVEQGEIISEIFNTQNDSKLQCETDGDYVIAAFDFKAQNENDLEFLKGDRINVLKRIENGWWIGLCRDKIGFFPCNFIQQNIQ